MKPRLVEKYNNEIIPKMMESFKYKNKLQVPRLVKIVVNMGVGEAIQDIKIMDQAMDELATITGQRPTLRRAKKAISNFKIREGLPVGCKVTLRRNMMYEFLDRLVNVALPRIRDFGGVPPDSFDQGGNYSLGLSEQTIFPEIETDKTPRVQGMDITIVTTAKNKEESKELLRLFGLPFRKN
ncbi:MAG: 50S ribosomal protein L5 [Candidatus Omnitrophica bacterium]|nr:50S ribosomal protein L5 [Candidatus Omnitrophota bacterium]HOX54728.1 50S ribosomal protein L5 [Candidatus Omnitrophota bacterium]